VPTLRPHLAKLVLIFYCAVLSTVYVFALVNAPLSLLSAARHDDGLFIEMARSLAALHWLGPYNQFTLAKGPGYPAFLALASAFGMSSSLAHALFHCLAIGLFVALCHRYLRSYLLSAILFTLLLWDPASFLGQNLRILRDTIYYGQVLLCFGVLAHALMNRNLAAGLIGGLLLGWLWLTREEGTWIVPGLAVLAAGAIYRAVAEGGIMRLAAAALAAIAAFGVVNAGFRLVNWRFYGAPVGVEYKETNFVRAIGAVHSVRSGGIKPFVSVTRAARQTIYPVSPSFAELAPYLDGSLGEKWSQVTCNIPELRQHTCGEIGAGIFAWTLRDAVALAGHYGSPREASTFYAKLASEINAACDSKQLECERQWLAELPPVTWSQLADVPQHMLGAVAMVFSARHQSVDGMLTLGTIDQFRADLRSLNFPFIMRPEPAAKMSYVLRGWYYRPGGGWISLSVSDNGQPAAILFERAPSPDIVTAFKDAAASNQRFEVQTFCGGGCVLRVSTDGGPVLEKPFADIAPGPIPIGDGSIFFDVAGSELSPLYQPDRVNRISYRLREIVLRWFDFIRIPLLIVGLVAAFGCLRYWRDALRHPAYVLGIAMWALAASRIFIISLLDATFVTTVNPVYLGPTGFVLTAGAVLWIAAWIELRRGAARTAALSAPAV
jgi:hypothetical protein